MPQKIMKWPHPSTNFIEPLFRFPSPLRCPIALPPPSHLQHTRSVHIGSESSPRQAPHTPNSQLDIGSYFLYPCGGPPACGKARDRVREGGALPLQCSKALVTKCSIVAFKRLQSLHKTEEDSTMVCALDSLALLRRPAPRSISDAT